MLCLLQINPVTWGILRAVLSAHLNPFCYCPKQNRSPLFALLQSNTSKLAQLSVSKQPSLSWAFTDPTHLQSFCHQYSGTLCNFRSRPTPDLKVWSQSSTSRLQAAFRTFIDWCGMPCWFQMLSLRVNNRSVCIYKSVYVKIKGKQFWIRHWLLKVLLS